MFQVFKWSFTCSEWTKTYGACDYIWRLRDNETVKILSQESKKVWLMVAGDELLEYLNNKW